MVLITRNLTEMTPDPNLRKKKPEGLTRKGRIEKGYFDKVSSIHNDSKSRKLDGVRELQVTQCY